MCNGLLSSRVNTIDIKNLEYGVLEDGVSINIKHIVLLLSLVEHSKLTYPVLTSRS